MVIVFSEQDRGGCVTVTVHWYNQDISCFHVMLAELCGQIVVSSCAGFYPHNNRLSSSAWSQPWTPALLVEPERRERYRSRKSPLMTNSEGMRLVLFKGGRGKGLLQQGPLTLQHIFVTLPCEYLLYVVTSFILFRIFKHSFASPVTDRKKQNFS